MKLKDGLALLREYVNEVEPNESFMQQLADYDLDQLSKNAFGKWIDSFTTRDSDSFIVKLRKILNKKLKVI